MESEVQISITCKGLWSPKTTGCEKELAAEIKELLSELLCLEKVEINAAPKSSLTKEDSETKNEGAIEFPDFVYYNLQSEKGKEIQDMVMILRSLKATEDQIFKVVQVNCGVPLTASQQVSF